MITVDFGVFFVGVAGQERIAVKSEYLVKGGLRLGDQVLM